MTAYLSDKLPFLVRIRGLRSFAAFSCFVMGSPCLSGLLATYSAGFRLPHPRFGARAAQPLTVQVLFYKK
ncbi:MAG: hypothetical protein RR597_03820, partial [Christensenella sp.]